LVAHNKGKKHTPETIAKMRRGFTKYLMSLDGFVGPNYNKSSIRFLDNLSKEKGWNL
jgi:hypothetical protein